MKYGDDGLVDLRSRSEAHLGGGQIPKIRVPPSLTAGRRPAEFVEAGKRLRPELGQRAIGECRVVVLKEDGVHGSGTHALVASMEA